MMRLSDSDLQMLALPSLNQTNSGMEVGRSYHAHSNGDRNAYPEDAYPGDDARLPTFTNRMSQEDRAEVVKVEQHKPGGQETGPQHAVTEAEPSTPVEHHIEHQNGPSTLAGLALALGDSQFSPNDGTAPAPELSPIASEADLEQGFLPVLKNRNFLALWSGQVFSQLA
ncbi:MAG TPA: hypothetical protein V6D04_12700, partial [Candidatus Obscuribacterales bacterium]